jgi:hypothetical protein
MTTNCLNCDKPIDQTNGRRERKYCGDNCRAAYHQKKKAGLKWVMTENPEQVPDWVREYFLAHPEHLVTTKAVNTDIRELGIGITHTDENGKHTRVDPLSEEGQRVLDVAKIDEQIVALIKERDNPPKEHSAIGKKTWRFDRQQKIDELQKLKKQNL